MLVASRGQLSGRSPRHSRLPQVPFPKNNFWQNRTMVFNNKKCKCYVKFNESPEIFGRREGGGCDAQPDAECEACLNRQILKNSVKKTAMEDPVKDRANWCTKNYEVSFWIHSLIKTKTTLAMTCTKHAPPSCYLSQQILKKLMKC
jgi:hypothetical protein